MEHSKFKACLLGGAIGDAFGYPVEFLSLREIKAQYGKDGLTDLIVDPTTHTAILSDDTQMTLFTANAFLLRKSTLQNIDASILCGSMPTITRAFFAAYQRWLYTQTGSITKAKFLNITSAECDTELPFIMDIKELYHRRAPGLSCLSALESGKVGTIKNPINNSKGCGGVMRVAPMGLRYCDAPLTAYEKACEAAAITHGHPTGYIAAGALAMILSLMLSKCLPVEEAVKETLAFLATQQHHEETSGALSNALRLANTNLSPSDAIQALGEGWIAEEALGVAVYCAIKAKTFAEAIIMAINHDGDSDSTGAICGNIYGAQCGLEGIPQQWQDQVELSNYICMTADMLLEIAMD